MRRTRILHPAAALMLLLGAGCEQGAAPLFPVHGKVFFRGFPVSTGTVVFTPDTLRGSDGPLASADIQPDGSFTLHTGDAPGAVPGWHRVTVMALEVAGPGPRIGLRRSLLPEKYRDPDLSGLSCEVKAGQDNAINLNLE